METCEVVLSVLCHMHSLLWAFCFFSADNKNMFMWKYLHEQFHCEAASKQR